MITQNNPHLRGVTISEEAGLRILRRAHATLLTPGKWVRGTYRLDGQVCMIGAVREAARKELGFEPNAVAISEKLGLLKLAHVYGYDYPEHLNDDEDFSLKRQKVGGPGVAAPLAFLAKAIRNLKT